MSTDLFISHGITAVYAIENGDVVVIGSTERALAEAEKRINTFLTTKYLTVRDQGVLQMPEWHDLKKQLQESFSTSKKRSEKRFVVVLQEDDMLEEEVDECTEGSFGDIDQVSCEVQMPGGVTVTVRKANICKLHVDAVVNAANEDLKHIGGLALALLQAAGPSLQQNCDLHTKANGPLKPGDAIITAAGRLPCKYVVHAVGPRFSDSDRHTTVQRLRRAVRESLNQATTRNCSSIAIPVISSGIFGCPLDLCTESIAKEVHEYIEDHNHRGSNSTLTEVHLVDNNGSTVNAMSQAVSKESVWFYSPAG
uniref:Macro domain-containing protein n=1 Tax=Cyprinus carpio TaxID=7962 RepID=A0A8C2KHV3_CYPCA